MFVLKKSPTYTWPVTIEFPVDNGKSKKESFDAEFKRVTESELESVRSQFKANELDNKDFAKDILVGWKGIKDEDGNDIPFTESTKAQLFDFPLVANEVVSAFFDSILGSKTKNS